MISNLLKSIRNLTAWAESFPIYFIQLETKALGFPVRFPRFCIPISSCFFTAICSRKNILKLLTSSTSCQTSENRLKDLHKNLLDMSTLQYWLWPNDSDQLQFSNHFFEGNSLSVFSVMSAHCLTNYKLCYRESLVSLHNFVEIVSLHLRYWYA